MMITVVRPTGGAPLVSAGMDKSGTQTLTSGVWTKIAGWTVRSGYAGTTITSDEIVVDGDGATTITTRVTFAGVSGAGESRIKVNGAVIETFTVGSSTFIAGSKAVTLTDGDTIAFEAMRSGGTSSFRSVQSGSGNTFVYFDA